MGICGQLRERQPLAYHLNDVVLVSSLGEVDLAVLVAQLSEGSGGNVDGHRGGEPKDLGRVVDGADVAEHTRAEPHALVGVVVLALDVSCVLWIA